MSASDAMENGVQLLVWNNVAFANIGDAGGLQPSAAPGNFYVSLHTGDPGEGGNQATSECTYTPYARQPIPRSGSGFTVSANDVTNAAAVTFPKATAGSETATHIGIGTVVSGSGILLFSAALDTPLAIAAPVQPSFGIGAISVPVD